MEVHQIMTNRPITIGPDEPVTAAAVLLRRCNLGAVPVCDGAGRLRGMVTDRDIVVRCLALDYDPATTRVSEIMSRGITTVPPDMPVAAAAEQMAKHQIRRLPVTDRGKLVGILSLCDLARRDEFRTECALALGSVSSNVSFR